MTKQEIFDTVVKHLKAQCMPALDPDGNGCMYRTRTGLACAVGILVTDEEAKIMDKSEDSTRITDIPLPIVPERLHPHLDLLEELQDIHDDGNNHTQPEPAAPLEFNMTMVANKLYALAEKHRLTFNYAEFLA